MARILLIDDDEALLDVLALAFEDAGHVVLRASDGDQGLRLARAEEPSAIVSDVNLPLVDGFTLCRRLREDGLELPIILLTSRDSEIDEALGLDLGADDYVTKPFSTRVLLARVAALLRRDALRRGATLPMSGDPGAAGTSTEARGKLSLDTERLEVRYAGVEVRVTVTEFRLLEVLVARPGVVYSRDQLLDRVRGDDSVVAQRIVDTYVRRLRRKLEAVDASFDGIETVVGAGYRWKSDGG